MPLANLSPLSHTHTHTTLNPPQGRNLARGFIDSVRERKGLPVTKKLVHDAEKQRNRKK